VVPEVPVLLIIVAEAEAEDLPPLEPEVEGAHTAMTECRVPKAQEATGV
jgi:hypothetical protein